MLWILDTLIASTADAAFHTWTRSVLVTWVTSSPPSSRLRNGRLLPCIKEAIDISTFDIQRSNHPNCELASRCRLATLSWFKDQLASHTAPSNNLPSCTGNILELYRVGPWYRDRRLVGMIGAGGMPHTQGGGVKEASLDWMHVVVGCLDPPGAAVSIGIF